MNPQELERLERIEKLLEQFVKSDRFIFWKTQQVMDGRNYQFGQTTGTKFGLSSSDKIGKWGVVPIIQPASGDQAAIVTTGATQTNPWGFTTAAQANAIVTLLNEIRSALVSTGEIKGGA